jgi:hypothetical protein
VSGTLSAGTVSIGVKSNTTGFGKNLHKSLIGQIGGIGKALGETIIAGTALVLGVGMKEAMDASAGVAQLNAGIKSTGNAAHVSVKGMTDLASSIQDYSGQTDDSIVATENLLLTFTNIKNVGPNKIFDQATVAAADMAAKMGGDASGMAIKLGKALNDPVKGMTALQRVGVAFTKGQKDSVAAMIKHGDTAGAQSLILAELTKEFGGAAKAAGNSLPGELKKGQRAFEDMSQSVVETFLPIIQPAISGLSKSIKDNTPAIQRFAKAFSEDIKNAIIIVTPPLKAFGSWIVDHKPLVIGFGVAAMGVALAFKFYEGVMKAVTVATATWTVIQGLGTAAMWVWNKAIGTSIGETLALKAMYLGSAIASGVMTAAQWLLNAALTANPIGIVVMAVAALVGAIILIATKTTWFQTVWEYMSGALGKAWQWLWNSILAPIIRFVLNGFASITDGIASMLNTLSNIPGFGWAKDAANKMSGAADKAHALANGIKDIKDKKVAVTVVYGATWSAKTANIVSAINSAGKGHVTVGANASGTDNWRGGPTWVNERGGEIIDLPSGSRVIPADKSAKMMDGVGSFDYDRMAAAMSRAQIILDGKNVARSVDQRLAPR